ncbi:hypothetical protein GW17_00057448, partial [Ensete ventricosum]
CKKSRDEATGRERKLVTESSDSDSGSDSSNEEQRQRREGAAAAAAEATIERNGDGRITSKIRVEEIASERWEADIGALSPSHTLTAAAMTLDALVRLRSAAASFSPLSGQSG